MNITHFHDGIKVGEKDRDNDELKNYQVACAVSETEFRSFSDEGKLQEWIGTTPHKARYLQNIKLQDQYRNAVNKMGNEKFEALQCEIDNLYESLTEKNLRLIKSLFVKSNAYDEQQVLEIGRSFISPKMGCMLFYRDYNRRNNFDWWNGVFHISNCFCRSNNDVLSSVYDLGATVSLFEHAYFQGRSIFFLGTMLVNSLATWPFYFDNIMSSYWFWG